MAVNVQQEAVNVEAYLHGLVEKQDGPGLEEHVSKAMKLLDRLTAAHDATLASVIRPSIDLKSLLRQFTVKSMTLKEARGEKRAIATLMASDEVANPDVLLDDLKILAELPDDSMHTNAEDNAAFVVHKMVEEFKSRQDLRDKLELLQSDRDAIQRVVSRKTESATKLAGMVHEIRNKANEAFLNLSVDPSKLPQKEAVIHKDLPGPLYVLFAQFSGLKAVYDDQVQVQVHNADSDVPGDLVEVTIPSPAESRSSQCTVCFAFSAHMSTVLAYSPTHPEILRQYDPNDTGEQWPHSIHTLQHAGSTQPVVPIKYKPFRWCQKLSGLDQLAPRSSSANAVHDTILGGTVEGFLWRIQQCLAT